MGEYHEHHLAALSPIPSSVYGISQVAFDHAEYRLDLPSLAVTFLRESLLHLATVFTFQWLVGLSSMCGRYRCSNVILLSNKSMIAFAVIAGISQQVFDTVLLSSRYNDILEHIDVWTGTASCDGRKDQMTVTVSGNR
jgi:hypothetical protein